jgi:hypothetical protein
MGDKNTEGSKQAGGGLFGMLKAAAQQASSKLDETVNQAKTGVSLGANLGTNLSESVGSRLGGLGKLTERLRKNTESNPPPVEPSASEQKPKQ